MSTTLVDASPAPSAGSAKAGDAPLRGRIWRLLLSMYPQAQRVERRQAPRFPFPRTVYLTPVAADGVTPVEQAIEVRGQHLSERGLGFYHAQPLRHRFVVASFEKGPDDWLHVLVDVNWCRFRAQGCYESGGRFLRNVHWPRTKPV